MQAQGSQQVSLLTPRPFPGTAGSVRALAGVAQLVEHLFCKQVVSGSIPLASSTLSVSFRSLRSAGETLSTLLSSKALHTKTSEGCPSGQREQAVNLPAHAYVGSNPTPSTIVNAARTARGTKPGMSNPRRGLRLPRSSAGEAQTTFSAGVTQLVESQFSKLKVDGSSPFSRSKFQGARRTKFAVRVTCTNTAHLAQLVEHVLGKDEVISSNLMVGSNLQP